MYYLNIIFKETRELKFSVNLINALEIIRARTSTFERRSAIVSVNGKHTRINLMGGKSE